MLSGVSVGGESLLGGLSLLDDKLLGLVLFSSGYLSEYWPDILRVLKLSKRILKVGRAFINRVDVKSCRGVTWKWLSQVLPKLTSGLTTLELDFCLCDASIPPPPRHDLAQLFGTLATTLTRLSLRGSGIDDVGMEFIKSLRRLEMLDLSKSSRVYAPNLTNVGLRTLCSSCTFQHLDWLNLSMAQIGDDAVAAIAVAMPNLRHLGLQCCVNLTDECASSLADMALETLDVSSCPLLTNESFFKLGNKQFSNCRSSLQSLFANYLPQCTVDLLSIFLVWFENLQVLEFKIKGCEFDESKLPPLDQRQRAKLKLKCAIFTHAEAACVKTVSLYSVYKS